MSDVGTSFFLSVDDIAIESHHTTPPIQMEHNAGAEQNALNKPDWLRVRVRYDESFLKMRKKMTEHSLHTVCEEARCPNIGECWGKGHATVMILGDVCTRACTFCNVKTGKPTTVDPDEPANVAKLVVFLKLNHVVITSVDRDDLPDGGAAQFASCIQTIREASPSTTIEVLTPDFWRKKEAYMIILMEKPDVFNHNIETVPRLYPSVKRGARYFNSLHLLHSVKEKLPSVFTKSGIIVGLGESDEEIFQVMDDLRAADVDFLTIGQYLQPTKSHAQVHRYVTPKQFELYKQIAINKGFHLVSSAPLTRSSYHAGEDFAKLRAARLASHSNMQ